MTFFDDEPLVVLNGDILTDVDLSAILAFHKEKKARATITMIRVTDPTAYGLIFTDGEGQVTRFLEKPSWDEATVDTTVNVNRDKFPVEYKLYRTNGGKGEWRIYDVVTDDVSLLETYQGQFRKLLADKGFDGLLSTLKAKRAQLEKSL